MKTKLFAPIIAAMLLINAIPFTSSAASRLSVSGRSFKVFDIAEAAGAYSPKGADNGKAAVTTAASTTAAKSTITAKGTTTTTKGSTTTSKISTTTTASTTPVSTTTTVTEPPDHKVKVLDCDGKLMETITVKDGGSVDLSKIDVSAMNKVIDRYTEQRFIGWTPYPEKITADIEIRALYNKVSLSCAGKPQKTEYYAKNGNIRLSGLEVKLSTEEQTPVVQPDGTYKITLQKEVIDITGNCTCSPANLTEAFKSGKTTATISVYPIIEDQAIFTFDVTYFAHLGDIDMNDSCDAADSSAILAVYAMISTGEDPKLSKEEKLRYDIDRNGSIDSTDASKILELYSRRSTDEPNLSWDEFLG